MLIKFPDPLHILFAQFEIKDVMVFGNMVRIGGTGDGDKACLQLPPEDDLRRRLSVLFCQFFDHFIAEMLGCVAPASEGIPGFDHDAVLTCIFLQFGILIDDFRSG